MCSRNVLLSAANWLIRCLLCLLLALALITTAVFMHWHLAPATYHRIDTGVSFKAEYGTKVRLLLNDQKPVGNRMSDLSWRSMAWLYLRTMAFIVIFLGIFWYCCQILLSIKDMNSFHKANITYFRRLGYLFLIASLLASGNVNWEYGLSSLHLSPQIGGLAFCLAAFVMAEVFSEGKKLLEDKRSII